jgi:NAD-dependent deacetylase
LGLTIVDLSASRVLVVTGAGVSAESGIPTFRGKDGYWRNLDPMKLATPEAFAENPQLVWEWYNERRERIRAAEPNAAHKAIVDLARRAREFLLVTQNVDDLHARAGTPSGKMVQIHGDIFETHCSRCSELDRFNRSSSGLSQCNSCGALMRPGVVWFGETLDPHKLDIVEEFLSRGDVDLALVIGTTALFGYITDWATRVSRMVIEINPEETPLTKFATESIRGPAAVVLPELLKSNRLRSAE